MGSLWSCQKLPDSTVEASNTHDISGRDNVKQTLQIINVETIWKTPMTSDITNEAPELS